ncbi:type I phosphomannose isomerase catalytic subunit [Orenia marismortui]|uniref:type I phosphomannose isomerase catalytic subunit n=1 Tax=Orenia marismortui TaxID=46469 RepID=UPI000374745D|nr:type I phosphomannose isomerase catalytic subunit [Orenia marismortui]
MYPLKFAPLYKEKIWGGRRLETKLNKELPEGKIGESWEIAAHEKGSSKIINGRLAGKTLIEAIQEEKEKILGNTAKNEYYNKFPLLIKILDANDKLSVQVHPDDNYANKHENGELGKTEMWYIIDSQEDAQLVYGVKADIDKEEFANSIKDGRLDENLIKIKVERGDVIFIPSGTVHTIEGGILLAEIQQNSDTTYRVYDWNRVGKDGKERDLHIDKALDVISFGEEAKKKVQGLEIKKEGYVRKILVACPYFITETLDIEEVYVDKTNGSRFYILMALEGVAKISYKSGSINLSTGETTLLPAALGRYKIEGNCKLIRSYIKEPIKLKEELEAEGYSLDDIAKIEGL